MWGNQHQQNCTAWRNMAVRRRRRRNRRRIRRRRRRRRIRKRRRRRRRRRRRNRSRRKRRRRNRRRRRRRIRRRRRRRIRRRRRRRRKRRKRRRKRRKRRNRRRRKTEHRSHSDTPWFQLAWWWPRSQYEHQKSRPHSTQALCVYVCGEEGEGEREGGEGMFNIFSSWNGDVKLRTIRNKHSGRKWLKACTRTDTLWP